jgi:NitT/TauT family transport system ATP-binding protein
MKQRVAIARSLACHPKVLLMDEPFGALDIQTKERMQEYLIEIWQRIKCSILMITHDVEEAVFLSQRIYVLSARPGTIQQELTIELPENRNYKIKREPAFYHYTDTILDLLRSTSTEESETQISQNTDIL